MKTLTLLLLLLSGLAIGQGFEKIMQGAQIKGWSYPPVFNEVITDSIVWRLQSVDNIGDSTCDHEWVYGPEHADKPYSCGVYHAGFHCSYDDMVRSQICRNCLRKETWREQWYQHREEPPKSEYEILEEKLNLADSIPAGYLFEPLDDLWDDLNDTLWIRTPKVNSIDTIMILKPW